MGKTFNMVRQGGKWLAEHRDTRNYLIYGANLFINPLRGAIGLAGKVYQGVSGEHYARNAHIANIARVGLAALTAVDTLNFDGVVETIGDAALTFALLTDTRYAKEKSLEGVGEDVKRLDLKKRADDFSDKIKRDR